MALKAATVGFFLAMALTTATAMELDEALPILHQLLLLY